jgi:hypothetical protein
MKTETIPTLGEVPVPAGATIVVLKPARRVVISLAARLTGLTEKALNQKIDNGDFTEGREWHKGPDGRRYIDLDGYDAWVVSKHKRVA